MFIIKTNHLTLKSRLKLTTAFTVFASLKDKQLLTETQNFECYCLMSLKNMQNIIIIIINLFFDNEANMSENLTSHNRSDDGNFGWSSDEFNGYFSC